MLSNMVSGVIPVIKQVSGVIRVIKQVSGVIHVIKNGEWSNTCYQTW